MSDSKVSTLASLPSVDRLLRAPQALALIAMYGRAAVADSIRGVLAELRASRSADLPPEEILQRVAERVEARSTASLRPVFNLTGVVLHTNLGRAPLPEEAIEAMSAIARAPSNLEFDLAEGRRGERDDHVEKLLCSLTGGASATGV